MMGNHFSKKSKPQLVTSNSSSNGGSSSSSSESNPTITNNITYKRELNTYEFECQQDPTLQNFDSALHDRTITAISVLANSEISSLSFDTFSQITGCLLDNNQEVVKIILDYKEDIWNNPEFFELVKDYFENSLQTLDFCTSLEKCLKKARDAQFIIQLALQLFEEEEGEEGGGIKYSKTLEELQNFKAVGDPFTEEFYQLFGIVYNNQVAMLERLKKRKKKLDKKLKSVKAWRRVSSIIFVSAFAAVLICSVVAATMAAPPVAAALAAAASIPVGSMGKWIDNLWKDYKNVLEGEKGVISIMEFGTKFAINDLKGIRVLVDRLEVEIRALVMNADFAMREEEAVRFGIEEIKKKLGVFMKSIEDLGREVDKSTRDIQRARTVVLQRIVKYPK